MDKTSRIYIAGHTGLVGSNLLAKLLDLGYDNLIYARHSELDLLDCDAVSKFFSTNRPEYVFLCAAKVGGINANNKYPADFIMNNIGIQSNVMRACYEHNIKKLLFLGSSCIYPRGCPQPIKEEYLMTGILEKTNSAYAMAKICGIEMCRAYNKQYGTNYICAMPPNIFGINDNFDLDNSHVLAAIMRKMHDAKESNKKHITLWGNGESLREFLFAEDLADGMMFLMDHFDALGDNLINIGSNFDLSVKELAGIVGKIVGFNGEIKWNTEMPNGTPRKLLDSNKINEMGWKPKYSLEEGIEKMYWWYNAKSHR